MAVEIEINQLLTNIVKSEHKILSVKGINYGIQISTDKGSIIDWFEKNGKAVIRGKPSTRKDSESFMITR